MTTALSKKGITSLKIAAETTQLRKRLARADQLFSEGLARLQSEYKARVRAAVLDEPEATASTPLATADTTTETTATV